MVADSGYGSEENYHFMDRAGIEAYVKYNRFHIEQRMHYEPDPFSQQDPYYNADEDYYVCPMEQHMVRIGTLRERTESGYVAEKARYRAQRCDGCPLLCRCFRHFGMDKVKMDFAFFAIAFNIKKMCSKINKKKQEKAFWSR